MKEQLFIIKDGERYELDLNNPSGISLNYKSNLFGDLSKITCSHSYTFRIPLTQRNRIIFDNAEEIRHESDILRKKLIAEYYQNGINLFNNANLYLESVSSSSYNAVMTWDAIEGLNTLKENDIPLNELPNDDTETLFGSVEASTEDESFDNTKLVLNPIYNSGIPYYRWNVPYKATGRPISRYTSFSAYPMPVVPVYKILQLINSHFKTKFNLGNAITIGNAKNFNPMREVVEKGVLPLVGKDLNYHQRLQRKCYLSGMRFIYVDTKISEENELYIPDVIQFTQVKIGAPGDYLESGTLRLSRHDYFGTNYTNVGVQPKIKDISVELDGCIQACFVDYPAGHTTNDEEVPTLSIYQRQRVWKSTMEGGRMTHRTYYEWAELDSVDGESVGTSNGYRIFEFDFALENGANRLSCENVKSLGGALIFVFNHRLRDIVSMQKDIEVFLKNSDKCISPHSIDVISNLPDIGCLAFVKSLFYMIGAFPTVTKDMEICPAFFDDIKHNIECGNTLDWSDKLCSSYAELPSEIKFKTGDFSQRNYYLMKSDDIDNPTDPDEENDIYASGIGYLQVNDFTLDKDKTIIQVPFFPPYILNRSFPSYETGNTIKSWTLSDHADSNERDSVYNRLEFSKPNPAIGIIKDRIRTKELNTGESVDDGAVMTMEIWNGFASMNSNPSFSYLQEIISKPYMITESINLDEFDLRDLDYSKPIYLSKYNSYFAVVSIKRDSKGKCKCELIKLP